MAITHSTKKITFISLHYCFIYLFSYCIARIYSELKIIVNFELGARPRDHSSWSIEVKALDSVFIDVHYIWLGQKLWVSPVQLQCGLHKSGSKRGTLYHSSPPVQILSAIFHFLTLNNSLCLFYWVASSIELLLLLSCL